MHHLFRDKRGILVSEEKESPMSFDGYFLHHMQKELSRELVAGRIQKISQPSDKELVLTIRSHHTNHKLLLSAHPILGRIHITSHPLPNPPQPSAFVMLLRKHLQGAIIESIAQTDNDRILTISVRNSDELGDSISVSLIIEIMGKHSNILLVDNDSHTILEVIKHVSLSQNSYRTLLPGAHYHLPPQQDNKLNPFAASDEAIIKLLHTTECTPKDLQCHWQGLGRDTAKTLSQRLATPSLDNFRDFFNQETYPSSSNEGFSAVASEGNPEHFASLSLMLDAYYLEKAERDRVTHQAHDMIQKVQQELEKNRKKLIKQKEELAATENAEIFRQKGELLTTYLTQIPNNQDSVTLNNYYTDKPITIALDVALTPNQNAQRYFKRYQKLKEAVKHLGKIITETQEAIHYLESVEILLTQASSKDIPAIREELSETGIIKKSKRDKTSKRLPPRKFLASDGKTIILVGRNNIQNDELSFKIANKNNLWFHAKDIPGSHVIITNNSDPSDNIKTEAAEIAAYFSKARLSNLVQVDMIEAGKLHKPTGSKPGFVTYRHQKTLRVTPDADKIAEMQISI